MEITFEKKGKQVSALVSIVNNKFNISLSFENGLPKLNINLTLVCEKEETFMREDIGALTSPTSVSKEGLKALESSVYEYIDQLINISKQSDCDFFGLKNLTYGKHNNQFARYKESLLQHLDYQIFVNAVNMRDN